MTNRIIRQGPPDRPTSSASFSALKKTQTKYYISAMFPIKSCLTLGFDVRQRGYEGENARHCLHDRGK